MTPPIALKKMDAFLQKMGIVKAVDDFKVKALNLNGPLKNYADRLKSFAEEIIKI